MGGDGVEPPDAEANTLTVYPATTYGITSQENLFLSFVAEARFELAIALWAIPAYETGELGHYSTLRC